MVTNLQTLFFNDVSRWDVVLENVMIFVESSDFLE